MPNELEITITLKGVEALVACSALKELRERSANNEIPSDLEFMDAKTVEGVCAGIEGRVTGFLKIFKRHFKK